MDIPLSSGRDRVETEEQATEEADAGDVALFRDEAVKHYANDTGEGNLLRASPRWAIWTYRVLGLTVLAALAYLTLGHAPIYEAGPALLRIDEVTVLNAPTDGIIDAIDVLPGQDVSAGDTLVRLRSDRESTQLERVREEFELQLLARLRDPNDVDAERELRRLRPELERAKASLLQTRIVAPKEGTIQDVRIRPGDFLEAGEPSLALMPRNPTYSVVALMPGHVLPQLERGMAVRLKIEGYAYAEISTTIESIGSQVIGPAEARRFLGPGIGDAVQIAGPVVVVRCRLEEPRFYTSSREYRIHDGMHATAEIEVRRERILVRLIPALKQLDGGRG
jgi:multidrug efflux pump subunit AcrA (membrane-fusion protein)